MRRLRQSLLGFTLLLAIAAFGLDLEQAHAQDFAKPGNPAICQQAVTSANTTIKKLETNKSSGARMILNELDKNLSLAKQAQQAGDYEQCVEYAHKISNCAQCIDNYLKWQQQITP